MALYEQILIARQDISSAQVDGLIDQLKQIAEDNGAKIAKEEYWGLKTMAYRIKKNRKGHYVLFNIDGPSAAIKEMERNMRLHEDVLRYLTLRVDEFEEGPSVMMQNRRDRRERRGEDERPSEAKPAAAESTPAAKPESTPAAKPESAPDGKPEPTPTATEA